MQKMKWAAGILVLALISISCQLFAPASQKDGIVSGDAQQVFAEQPVFDLQAPQVSPGAAALRVLAGWDPSVSAVQGDVEAAERAALDALIKKQLAQPGSSLMPVGPLARVADQPPGALVLAGYHNTTHQDELPNATHDVSLIAALLTGLGDIISQHMPPGSMVNPSETIKKGDTTAVMSADIGKSTDGSSKFGLGYKTETVKDGKTTSTDFAGSVDGQRCPTAEGQVSMTVKVRLGASSGTNAFNQDLTAFVRAVVDDNAQIATTTIDLLESTRQVTNGRNLYIESGMTVKYNGDGSAGTEVSNLRLMRSSQAVTQADLSALSSKSHEAAFSMGRTALLMAQGIWRSGGCVKIEAASPGKVAAGSTSPIAVTVMHKYDGSTVPSKLEAALAGQTSLVPSSLAKTPGTLTYTAPAENGKAATINLTATSRRGIATLALTANTGGQNFIVDADSEGAHFSGTICGLDQPFRLKLAASGETWNEAATPNGSAGGQMGGVLTTDGCTFNYQGPYTIVVNENGNATLQWTNDWSADCPGLGSKSGTANHAIPLQPAPDSACP